MEKLSPPYVSKAHYYFSIENYDLAEKYYILAQEKIGSRFFKTNIWLCQTRKIFSTDNENKFLTKIAPPDFEENNTQTSRELSSQLNETQNLLEKYYKEALDLRAKLSTLGAE